MVATMVTAVRMVVCAALWCAMLAVARDCDELDLAGGTNSGMYGVIPPNPTIPIECDGHLSLISAAMFDREAEHFAAALADPAGGAVTSLNLNFVRPAHLFMSSHQL